MRPYITEIVQLALHVQGLYSGRIDNDWGPLTEKAYASYVANNHPTAVKTNTPPDYPKWLVFANRELGQSEVAGSTDNQRIVEYHSSTTLKATSDEVPWCSSFVNWCLAQCGIVGTQSAAARSWLSWQDGVTLPSSKIGAIAVFRRGNSSWEGHVAFFLAERSGLIEVLGGNQSNKVSVAKYPKSSLIGYVWPSEFLGGEELR